MLVLVQFIGQAIGLCVLRWRIARGAVADDPHAWKVRFLPLVAIVQLSVFAFIFGTSPNWAISGDDPLIDLALLFVVGGAIVWACRQKAAGAFPFASSPGASPSRLPLRKRPSLDAKLTIAAVAENGAAHDALPHPTGGGAPTAASETSSEPLEPSAEPAAPFERL